MELRVVCSHSTPAYVEGGMCAVDDDTVGIR
jgi:hypothetical protein